MKFKSTCSYCGTGCGIIVDVDKLGKLSVEGDVSHPVNKGMLCSKGLNLHYVVADTSDRLLYPQSRLSKSHPMQRVSWDAAIERVAHVFKTFISKYGPDSVAFYVSGQCLTEEYYLANKLMKGFIGSNNIDTNSRLCMSSAVVGYKKVLGEDAVPISYDDIELSDTIFITGANPAFCHPIIFRRIEAHKNANPDVKIIVVDPRKTQSCSIADVHLQITPGTDVVLYQAIARILIEKDLIDAHFIEHHTDGYEAFRQEVMRTSVERAAEICGVALSDIETTATYIGNAKAFISMWAMGLNQSANGVDKNVSLLSLSLITGQIGKPGAGPFSLTGQPNAMGGREVGGMANLLSAHRDMANPVHRQEIATYWNVDSVPAKPGYTATEMMDALDNGQLKAIWIVCTNPMVSMPNSAKVEQALTKAKFVVVQDISMLSDTVAFADVLLPAAGWLEKDGTMTNSDRRITYLPKAIDPPGEALADNEIFLRFAKKMGFHGFDFASTEEIFAEHAGLTRGTHIDVSGLTYKYLQSNRSVQWPYTDNGGTSRLFEDGVFYTPNQRAQFVAAQYKQSVEVPTPELPLILTTGRVRDQWHTRTKTGKVSKLTTHLGTPYLEMHPADALERGIAENAAVEIFNGEGKVQVKAKITDEIKQGVVFLPMHWGKILQSNFARTNNLTSSRIDPYSKEPDFKYSTVQVRTISKPKEKIIVIGAGAAAYQFIVSYRKLNVEDEIQVFSLEEYPFYNRILLPDYFNGALTWRKLLKIQLQELANLNVTVHTQNGIQLIDTESRCVLDSLNVVHKYDKILLATGSSPILPPSTHTQKGVFGIRNRSDADALEKYLSKGDAVLVVGGGLLGLEMAASLNKMGMQVSLLHRSSKLMDKQLDTAACNILSEEVRDRGISLLFNDEVETLLPTDNGLEVALKSGRSLHAKAVVYAIGTRPNVALAKNAHLKIGRGVVVNSYMQSSDPNIYVAGEIAEYEGNVYGIAAAAEEQADVVAQHISGNQLEYYSGTLSMNILKIPRFDLCSIGTIHYDKDDTSYEEIVFLDASVRYYKKCIIRNDRLVGAILIGDRSEFLQFKKLIADGTELGDLRKTLLRSGKTVEPVLGKLVCSCNNVGADNIRQAVAGGCKTVLAVGQQTGAGMGCGSCKPEIKAIIRQSEQ